jgi:hypothetical protein
MDVMHLYHHLKRKGIKVMMWADILQKPSFERLIDFLPRDIIMADWTYVDVREYRSMELFQDKGFDVIGCSWYRPRNIAWLSCWADKIKAPGMMYTTWAGADKSISIVEREFKQVMGYITQGDYAWNPSHRRPAGGEETIDALYEIPYFAGQVLREQWYPETRQEFSRSGFAVNLNGFVNTRIVNHEGLTALGNFVPGDDLQNLTKSSVAGELHLMDNIHYRLATIDKVPAGLLLKGVGTMADFPNQVTGIPINRCASELNFLHLFLQTTGLGQKVGLYRIHYEDGTIQDIVLTYGENIGSWNEWVTYYSGNLAWLGYRQSNNPVFIRSLRWKNPHPDKKIVSFDFIGSENPIAPVLLSVTGLDS